MTLSIWRYSHYLLALIAGVFIFIASVTGIILVFEPLSKKANDYFIEEAKHLSLADAIKTIRSQHDDIVSLSVDEDDFVLANLTTDEGESGEFYINPVNGEILGKPEPKAKLFEFATNLHRSLFLKSTGRFIVGLVSFLLLLIAISGFVLVSKRQGGIKKWFSKVVYEKSSSFYHVVLSRLTIIPIVIITLTGVLLSLDRFSVLPKEQLSHEDVSTEPLLVQKQFEDFEVFKEMGLLDISSLEFPFSPFEDDFFILKTPDKEVYINQIHGGIISRADVSAMTQVVDWSLFLHTGQGSSTWAIVLGLSSVILLILMLTGYKMAYDRIKNSKRFTNVYTAQEAEYILLVGSETGSTYTFAYRFAKAMLEANQAIYVDNLDAYSPFSKTKHIIVFTATYGEGESPSNSESFLEKLMSVQPASELKYSVLGFGSLLYPEYCQYAIDVNQALQKHTGFSEYLPLHKINNQSEEAFKTWVAKWNENQSYTINIQPKQKKIKGLRAIKVKEISELNRDDTYLMRLKPKGKLKYRSGDLLAFYPKEDLVERQYSVARIDNEIVLSIKRHELGVCSNYLFSQQPTSILKARLKKNPDFHIPAQAKEVLMISNGTGIAPFLGMINEHSNITKHLFWGGRTEGSYTLYASYIEKALKSGNLNTFELALSREANKERYVQDLLIEHEDLVLNVLSNNGIVMICGSIAMQNQVLECLGELTYAKLQQPLSDFQQNDQLKMDCY